MGIETKNIARPDIKPAFAERNVPVALATDETYLPYAAVTINSLVANTKSGNIDVLILHAGIREQARVEFFEKVRKCERLSVRFVDIGDSVIETVARNYVQHGYISVASLFRVFIPQVFTAYDRLVYLDVDLVACHDISEMYATDLAGCLVGAVCDYGIESYVRRVPHYCGFVEKHGFSDRSGYVNAGMLLLDLVALRSADIIDKLLSVAMEASEYLFDQDALNFVCKGRIKHLDPRWNVQLGDDNREKQLAATGGEIWIAHYTSEKKPWKMPARCFSFCWWRYVAESDFPRLWEQAWGDASVPPAAGMPKLSVIMPVYNAKRYLSEAIASVLMQKELPEIELICIDDGSTDDSAEILEFWQHRDARLYVLRQKNQGPGAARNAGLDTAKGEYVCFLDSDDRLSPGDAFLRAYGQARRDDLDLLLAASSTIDECGRMLCEDIRINNEFIPKKPVFAPDEPGVGLFVCTSQAPWGKFYRRAFLDEKKLRFPALKRSEDFPMVELAMALAARIGVFRKSICEHRTGTGSSLESTKDETPLVFFEAEQWLRDSLRNRNLPDRFCAAAQTAFINHLAYNLGAVRKYSSFKAIFEKYRNERTKWIRWDDVGLFERHAPYWRLIKAVEACMDDDGQIALFIKLSLEREKKPDGQLAEIKAKLKDAQAAIDRRNTWLADARAAVDRRNIWVAEARAAVKHRDERIAALEAAAKRRDERIGKLERRRKILWLILLFIVVLLLTTII